MGMAGLSGFASFCHHLHLLLVEKILKSQLKFDQDSIHF